MKQQLVEKGAKQERKNVYFLFYNWTWKGPEISFHIDSFILMKLSLIALFLNIKTFSSYYTCYSPPHTCWIFLRLNYLFHKYL